MLEFEDRFRLGRNGFIPVQVQVLLPIYVIEIVLQVNNPAFDDML